jgi:oligopeptide transport system ATP-binding protein
MRCAMRWIRVDAERDPVGGALAPTDKALANPSGLKPLPQQIPKPLLQVEDLRIAYGETAVVDGISFEVAAGEALAIVGESGSGKSQTALALLGLLEPRARVTGSVGCEGLELVGATTAQLNTVRGTRIGMVFQDSMASLNPHLKIGTQVAESLQQHRGLARQAAWAEARRLLDAVQIPDAARRLFQFPHECSGGMRQRIAIAIALACRPQLLITDEPTTALDMTVQAQILHLLAQLRRELGLAVLLITHDFGVVEALCERVLVMHGGRAVEQGPTMAVLAKPQQDYTRTLLSARRVLREAGRGC